MRNRSGLRGSGRRWLASAAIAALLALGLGIWPAAVREAHAAGPLRLASDATYTLDPDSGRVHVAVQFRATNLKPSTPTIVYFYRDLAFAIQPDAKVIRATDSLGALSVTTHKRKFFVETEVHLRSAIYYQQSTTFTISYDLVGGAPRSTSPIRVGQAFATFGVWAWGDVGRSIVEVRTPKGFENEVDGDEMQSRNAASGQSLFAEPEDPATFYAIVSSENRAAYGATRISLEGDVEVVVMAWPEDDAWDDTVSSTLTAGLPELLELIGLEWPVDHDLTVRERYTPALEGYAGFFFTDEERIDVSEDLDPALILHEASHAWFNDALFTDRWVYEGLADEYASRVQTAIGGETGPAAERPDLDDPGYAALADWSFPRVIRDQETDDLERYGYQAAFWVMHEIVDEVGVERMRAAFLAADANLTAYPGAGEPEKVASADSWRRFLDLVEPPDEPTSDAIDALLRELVVRRSELPGLANRAEARDAYRALVDAGAGWLPPWYVREQMGTWRFDSAEARMAEATAVLELRDRVAAAAGALDLSADDALQAAYEDAADGFDEAAKIGEDQLEALAALDGARTKVTAQPDLIAQLGLLGETPPATPYEAARAAFERGELQWAVTGAAAAVAIVTGAAAVGEQRLLMIVAAGVALVLLLIVLAVVVRRQSRRRRLALSAAASTPGSAAGWAPRPEPDPWGPAPNEPYATLAADPADDALPAANAPDVEGDERT